MERYAVGHYARSSENVISSFLDLVWTTTSLLSYPPVFPENTCPFNVSRKCVFICMFIYFVC